METLRRRARQISAFGKGILALDTAPTELAARLRAAAVVPTAAAAAAYRAMMLATPGLPSRVSGVVLPPWDLRPAGPLTGVRADAGFEPLAADDTEVVTSGVDGLAARLREFRERGAAFAVWGTSAGAAGAPPTLRALAADAATAARFGYACQHAGLVPVIRVGTRLRHGSAAERRGLRTAAVIMACRAASDLELDMAALVLSTTVEPGDDITGLLAALPPTLGGVAFSPGAPAAAAPCPVTFYAGCAVTWPALLVWGGSAGAAGAAHEVLHDGLATAAGALIGSAAGP